MRSGVAWIARPARKPISATLTSTETTSPSVSHLLERIVEFRICAADAEQAELTDIAVIGLLLAR